MSDTASRSRQLALPAIQALAAPDMAALLLDELSRLELDRMTPLEALTLLCDWKGRFGGNAR